VIPRRLAFWTQGCTITALTGASSVPTPLYPSFQSQFGMSDLSISLAFGGYPLGLLVSLLVLGSLSDYVGRRPVIIAAALVEAAGMVTFLLAGDEFMLIAARLIQGFATGAAVGALGAFLVELADDARRPSAASINSVAPVAGTALGASISGLVITLIPGASRTTFAVAAILFVVLAAATWATGETWHGRAGAARSLIPRVSIPLAIRRRAVLVLPAVFLGWSLSGITLAFAPALLELVVERPSPILSGLVVLAMCVPGAAGAVLLASARPRVVMQLTMAALVLAGAVLLVAALGRSLPAYFVGTGIAGFGIGISLLGGLRELVPLAPVDSRAGVISTIYTSAYLGMALPAILLGALAVGGSLFPVFAALTVGIAALSLLTGIALARSRD
jgi:MFS family permease